MGQQTIKEISSQELLAQTLQLKTEGYRLVAITSANMLNKETNQLDSKNGTDMSYSFDKDYDLINLRFTAGTDEEIKSISVIYPYAFLYENEIKELFGVNITDISLDFKDTLYKIPVKTPFNMKKEDK